MVHLLSLLNNSFEIQTRKEELLSRGQRLGGSGSPSNHGATINGRVPNEALHGSVRPNRDILSRFVATLRTDLMTRYRRD